MLKLSYWESEKERNARHWIVEIAAFRAQLEQERLKAERLAEYIRSLGIDPDTL